MTPTVKVHSTPGDWEMGSFRAVQLNSAQHGFLTVSRNTASSCATVHFYLVVWRSRIKFRTTAVPWFMIGRVALSWRQQKSIIPGNDGCGEKPRQVNKFHQGHRN